MKSFCSPVLGISFGNGDGVLFLGQRLTIPTRCFSFLGEARMLMTLIMNSGPLLGLTAFLHHERQHLSAYRVFRILACRLLSANTVAQGTRYTWARSGTSGLFWNLLSGLLCFDFWQIQSLAGHGFLEGQSIDMMVIELWTLQFEIEACLARLVATGGEICPLYGRRGGIARLTQSSHVFSNDLMTTTLHPE